MARIAVLTAALMLLAATPVHADVPTATGTVKHGWTVRGKTTRLDRLKAAA